jgi:hypothetical protein
MRYRSKFTGTNKIGVDRNDDRGQKQCNVPFGLLLQTSLKSRKNRHTSNRCKESFKERLGMYQAVKDMEKQSLLTCVAASCKCCVSLFSKHSMSVCHQVTSS